MCEPQNESEHMTKSVAYFFGQGDRKQLRGFYSLRQPLVSAFALRELSAYAGLHTRVCVCFSLNISVCVCVQSGRGFYAPF